MKQIHSLNKKKKILRTFNQIKHLMLHQKKLKYFESLLKMDSDTVVFL